MPGKKRIEYIDLAKGICILLVVSMHVAPDIGGGYGFLTCLRMPLYYCLSGMFFKQYGGFNSFLIKKTDKLLLPFLAWYLIGYLVYYIRVFAIGEPEHIFRITDLFTEPEFYNGSLWFLLSLFWCNLLFYPITKISDKAGVQAVIVFLLASIGWIWSYADLHNFLYIGTTLTCLPFFFIGRELMGRDILKGDKNLRKDIGVFIGCMIIAMACLLLPEEPVFMRFYLNHIDSGDPLTLYICSVSLVVMTLILCKYVVRLPYVSYLGRYSIIVLVTHVLIYNIINRGVRHLTGMPLEDATFDLILLLTIIASMAIVIPVCRKYLPYITAQKNLLEDRIRVRGELKAQS